MARTPVVVAHEASTSLVRDPDRTASVVVGVLGLAFAVIGAVEIVLLWIPLNLGNALWEFGTYGGSLDRMPMIALGMGLLALAAVWHPSRRGAKVRVLSVLFLVLSLMLIGIAVLYVTSVPAALGRISPQAVARVHSGLLQGAVEAFLYPLVFLGLSFVLWRSVRKSATR